MHGNAFKIEMALSVAKPVRETNMWLSGTSVLAIFALFGTVSAVDPWLQHEDENVNVNEDYLGCYADDKAPAFPLSPWHNRQLDRSLWYQVTDFFGSKKNCVDACSKKFFKYAGLQAGFLCFCGNDFNKYGRLYDYECNIKCRGNHLSVKHLGRSLHGEFWEDCGGKWANSVYSTYGLMQQEHKIAQAKLDDAWLWEKKK